MSILTEEKEIVLEEYTPGAAFDHSVKHSDTYYEQYITAFEPNAKRRWFYRFVKRSFDVVAAFLMLVILLPILLLIAIAVKCDSKGPAIFKQARVGRGGKAFWCYKFRTMRIDAPHDCATSLLENPAQYRTRVGKLLRKTSLDELPQLWCVLVGTMSFLGYRPLILNEENCNDMRERLGVFAMRPGISGYAQVHGRDDVYYKNKAILDAIYVKKASIWFDLKLVFQTVAVVLKREGNEDDAAQKEEVKEEVVQ